MQRNLASSRIVQGVESLDTEIHTCYEIVWL
jgi:hypothetical protein